MSKALFFILLVVLFAVGVRRWRVLRSGMRGFLREFHAGREGRSDIEITARPAEARPASDAGEFHGRRG